MRIILILAAIMMTSVSVRADDSSSGCGVGWMVTKKNSLVSSFVRNLTNFTFSNTIAMTSGTSGCASHSIVKNDSLPQHFAESNHQQLMVEMAKGQGEYLQAFAWTLGCQSDSSYQLFQSTVRGNYEQIYNGSDVTPAEVLKNVRSQMKQNPALARSCNV